MNDIQIEKAAKLFLKLQHKSLSQVNLEKAKGAVLMALSTELYKAMLEIEKESIEQYEIDLREDRRSIKPELGYSRIGLKNN